MASGRTHDIINLAALPAFVYFLKPESFTGFFTGYLIGTFFLSPDNDIFHSKPNKRWKFFRFLWKPYTNLFSHRGLSHVPVVGIGLKLVYLLSVFILSVLIISGLFFVVSYFTDLDTSVYIPFDFSEDTLKTALFSPFFVSFIVGLILSEIVHIATDIFFSFFKKLFRFS